MSRKRGGASRGRRGGGSHRVDVQVPAVEADGRFEADGDQERLGRLELGTTFRLRHGKTQPQRPLSLLLATFCRIMYLLNWIQRQSRNNISLINIT